MASIGKALPIGWQTDIIKALGGEHTPAAEHLLSSWQQWEGGGTHNGASYNPFNTMHGKGYPRIGIGISAYPDWQTGVRETAATLQSYPSLSQAITTGRVDFNDPGLQADLNYWLSGKRTPGMTPYVQKIARSFGADVPLAQGALSVGTLPPPPSLASPPAAPSSDLDFLSVALGKTTPLDLLLSTQQDVSSPSIRSPGIPGGASASYVGGGDSKDWTFGAASSWTGGQGKNIGAPGQGTHGKNAPAPNWESQNAWDVGVPAGTPIYAQEDGVVASNIGAQKSRPGDGLRLEIQGGDTYWLGHLSRITVGAGQQVQRGQIIGYSGKSQNGAEHLHIARKRGWG